jgi:hypothetical protein
MGSWGKKEAEVNQYGKIKPPKKSGLNRVTQRQR